MRNLVLKFSLLQILVVLALVFAACSDDKTAGTVTDTGNTIALEPETRVSGVVTRTDGSAASEVVVRMARRVSFEEALLQIPEHMEVVTDTAGVFSFDSALADTFQLAVIDTASSEVFYLPRTTRGAGDVDSIQLEKAAVFSSILYYEDVTEPAVPVGSHFVVYMTGTPFFQSVFAGDSFSVLIPSGKWWMEFFPGDPQIVAKLQDSEVADSLIFRSWDVEIDVESGDSVSAGPFMWSTTTTVDSLIKEEEEEAKIVSRIGGTVLCKSGSPCKGVEVALITDLFGFKFEGDSLEFRVATTTDSLGRWWLPLPVEVPDDSFRVEYRLLDESKVVQTGVSRYVMKKEIADLEDTLLIGETKLSDPSALVYGVMVVVDRTDTTQSSNCMVNSVVVGIKGTSHFIREVTCNPLKLKDLPEKKQDVVLYSGDPKVVSTLMQKEIPLDDFVSVIHVSLQENTSQEVLWLTYSPPTLK